MHPNHYYLHGCKDAVLLLFLAAGLALLGGIALGGDLVECLLLHILHLLTKKCTILGGAEDQALEAVELGLLQHCLGLVLLG